MDAIQPLQRPNAELQLVAYAFAAVLRGMAYERAKVTICTSVVTSPDKLPELTSEQEHGRP